MRTFILLGVSALALTACHVSVGKHGRDGATRVVARLTCPERQGDLLRSAVAADGRTCSYTAPSGGEVTLRLVSLAAGGPEPTLAPIEADLRAVVPPPAPRPPTPPQPPAVAGREDVDIDLPFFRVRTRGENAQVEMPGISVDARDDDAQVNVNGRHGERVRVNARGGASEVRVNRNGRDLRSTYLLTREEPTGDGWRLAGYQARGPRTGPLVVATVRSRTGSHALMDQVDDLIDASFRGPDTRSAAEIARADAAADRAAEREDAIARAVSARAERAAQLASSRAERAAERAAELSERNAERIQAQAEAAGERAAAQAEAEGERAAARAEAAARAAERAADSGRRYIVLADFA